MNKITSIQLKAAFLMVIFGLNMAVGFACALGVDMNFNSHHHDEEATEIHVHADGKKHIHQKKLPEHHHDDKTNSKKDDCCNDKVVKISLEDKAVPQFASITIPVFFSAFIASYYNLDIAYPSQVTASIRYFTRCYHPPIPDIRIAIQSFQI
jgi:hypothetical protein